MLSFKVVQFLSDKEGLLVLWFFPADGRNMATLIQWWRTDFTTAQLICVNRESSVAIPLFFSYSGNPLLRYQLQHWQPSSVFSSSVSLGKAFVSPQLEEFSSAIPIMYEDVLLHTGVFSNDFIEYVVCPSCHSVYDFQDCIDSVGREKQPKICSHVPYPNHRSCREPCRHP